MNLDNKILDKNREQSFCHCDGLWSGIRGRAFPDVNNHAIDLELKGRKVNSMNWEAGI